MEITPGLSGDNISTTTADLTCLQHDVAISLIKVSKQFAHEIM